MKERYRPDQLKTAEWLRDAVIQFHRCTGAPPQRIEISPETWEFLLKPGAIAGIPVTVQGRLWPWEAELVG